MFGPLQAVIFDLDGTIVDTAPDLHDQLRITLDAWGRPCPPLEAIRTMVGDGARLLIERGFASSGGLPPEAGLDELYQAFLERYTAQPVRFSQPFDGLERLLDQLIGAGLRLGICTNKPQAPSETLLMTLGLATRFGALVGGDVLPVRKPNPGHLDEVLRRLEVPAERAVMVGDTRTDLLAARAAGLPCVLVSFGYTDVPAADLGADHVIEHLGDLESALVQLAAR